MNLKDWMVTAAAYKVTTSDRPKWKGWIEEGASAVRLFAIVWIIGASFLFFSNDEHQISEITYLLNMIPALVITFGPPKIRRLLGALLIMGFISYFVFYLFNHRYGWTNI